MSTAASASWRLILLFRKDQFPMFRVGLACDAVNEDVFFQKQFVIFIPQTDGDWLGPLCFRMVIEEKTGRSKPYS